MGVCPICNSLINLEKPDSTSRELEIISLSEMCKLLDRTVDKDALLNMIIRMTPDIVESEEASISILSEDREEIIFCYVSSDQSENLQKIHLKYGEGIAGWVIREGLPVVVNEVEKDPRFCRRVDEELSFKTRNIVCVPIKVENRIHGALSAVNKKHNGEFNFLDLKICEAIASQAGVAIERAKLVEENMKSARLAAIGETTSSLAHSVKNILNGLQSASYLVNRGIEKEDLDMLKKGWHLVENNIEKISRLVMNMLYYSKDRKPEYSFCDLRALVDEVFMLLRGQAEKMNVDLKVLGGDHLPPVSLDKKEIYNSLVNLVTNGIEACTEGGSVTVSLSFDTDDHFIIEVSDTGCGMDENMKKILFTKFFSTKGSRGTGLGLPIVHKTVKEHGGSIKVKSNPGEGTTFIIRLPSSPEVVGKGRRV